MDRQIAVRGERQTGRTERVIWMCVGSILEGGHPIILTRHQNDRNQTKSRLIQALESVGHPQSSMRAHQCVKIRSEEVERGQRGITFREVDDF